MPKFMTFEEVFSGREIAVNMDLIVEISPYDGIGGGSKLRPLRGYDICVKETPQEIGKRPQWAHE